MSKFFEDLSRQHRDSLAEFCRDDEERQRQEEEDDVLYMQSDSYQRGEKQAPGCNADKKMPDDLSRDRRIKKAMASGLWLAVGVLVLGAVVKIKDDLVPPRGKKFSVDS